MKRILILLIGLISVAQAQFAPTSTKSAFKWGISAGTRDSTAYGANDSLVVVINRQGRMMYRSTDGYWKILSNAGGSDFVPYTGAVDNVALGNYRLTARSIRMDSIYANGSGGAVAVTNSGTRSFSWGAGGSSEVTFYGFAGMDFNRSGSMTNTSFTPKIYVDSALAVERDRAEYVESTKANASDVFQTIVVEYSSSGWNTAKTQYTFSANLPNYNVFNNTIGRYLLDGEITKTITSFTLTDTARIGDVFFITGALGTPSSGSPTADQTQVRIEKFRSKLQGKSDLGIGLISLTDIGVTQSNPYDLKFWYDGAIVWPLKKVDSLFNPLWRQGGISYIDSLGAKWESISVVKMNDPSLDQNTRIYYVQYNGGVDDTTRGSYAQPFKRLNYANLRAITVAQRDGYPYEIRILDQWVGTDGGLTGSGLVIPDGVKGKIVGYNSNGTKTRLVGQRENYTDALFNWQYIGFGTWACYSSSINTATKQSPMQFDLLYRDADSAPMPMYYIAPQADSTATITAIQNRPASFGYFTSGGNTTMYVHTFDGRKPTIDNWVYDEGISAQMNFNIGEGATMYIENIERFYNVTGVQLAGIRARPINVPLSYLTHSGQFWIYNVGIYGCSGQGYQLYDIQYGGAEFLTVKHTREDAENYHTFNALSYTPNNGGDYMNLYSNFSISEHLGENNFKSQPAIGNSTNAISAHTKINLISLNSFGGYTYGAVAAHVGGVQALHMNTHYYFATLPPNIGPPGVGSPKVIFWADSENASPVTKFTIIGGSGNTQRYTNIFSATNNGQIYHFLQKGKTTTETYNGGTVTNLNY